jgi:REP element-mobilizing transposase RayT
MAKYKDTYRIESARLKEWDYSNPWWYYITVNTKNHISYFGKIEKEKSVLNEIGKVAEKYWKEIPNHFSNIELDYYVIMPNHIHGVIIINQTVETRHASSLHHKHITLSDIIGSFKSAVTKFARENGYTDFSWQPRFYNRIIRNEK